MPLFRARRWGVAAPCPGRARRRDGPSRSPSPLPIALLVALAIASGGPEPCGAQDAAVVGPDVYRCTLENDRVRVCEIALAPGASVGMHSHPEHVAYMITGGTLAITTPDGKSSEWVSRPGYTAFAPAESHALRNVGDSEVRGVIVEFLAPFATSPAAGESRAR
jgi:quercetin dioxygenase-like cupin family protein